MSSVARAWVPVAAPTIPTHAITSSTLDGSRVTTSAVHPSVSSAASTAPDGTAQTSHRSCVRMRSGAIAADRRRVEGVDRLARAHAAHDRAVDLAGHGSLRERGAGDNPLGSRRGGVVAFVRDALRACRRDRGRTRSQWPTAAARRSSWSDALRVAPVDERGEAQQDDGPRRPRRSTLPRPTRRRRTRPCRPAPASRRGAAHEVVQEARSARSARTRRRAARAATCTPPIAGPIESGVSRWPSSTPSTPNGTSPTRSRPVISSHSLGRERTPNEAHAACRAARC